MDKEDVSEYIYRIEYCCCSVAQSCLILWNPMDCRMPGFPVLWTLPELVLTQIYQVSKPSNHFTLCCPLLHLPLIFASIRVFSSQSVLPIRWSKCWNSTSASVLPMNILGWFLLGLTDLIYFQSKELSRGFSNTTVQNHQFVKAQASLWSNSHINTWLLEKQ